MNEDRMLRDDTIHTLVDFVGDMLLFFDHTGATMVPGWAENISGLKDAFVDLERVKEKRRNPIILA